MDATAAYSAVVGFRYRMRREKQDTLALVLALFRFRAHLTHLIISHPTFTNYARVGRCSKIDLDYEDLFVQLMNKCWP